MRILLIFSIISVFLIFSNSAEARRRDCRNDKPICGNPNICHSNERAKNINDLKQSLHPTLCTVMNDMEKRFGHIGVLAAYRRDNASRGGARNSMHLKKAGGPSMAVDLRVSAKRKDMYGFLGSEKCKGIRYNIYCNTGTVHVDVSRNGDNYSHCRDFFRSKCASGGSSQNDGSGYKSPAVAKYKAQPRTKRPKCWNAKKWGSCCGPARKRNGLCSG